VLTPQEVAEKTFSANDKRTTGYDMQEVDTFLDQITADYAALANENNDLRIKLKLLADKVNEYRETEGAIRATLYTAQKTANNLVAEAQQKREAILNALEEDIRSRKQSYDDEIADCHARLAAARQQTASYVASVRKLTADHQRYLDALPEEIVGGRLSEEYEEEQDAVEVARQAAEQVENEPVQIPELEPELEQEPQVDSSGKPVLPRQEEQPTARIDFSNLKLGKDYEV
jgi:cell division initiation protein